MPQSVLDVLGRRLEDISRRPVVRHVPGRIGVANFGLRASYGGFNSYLLEKSNLNLTAPVNEGEQQRKSKDEVRRRFSTRRSSSNRKRKSHGGCSPAPAKKSNRKRSL
ncbi:hypothetical protein TcWFU_010112 [Taenia crassiceps]|uniref:Uncharacterized protein n=1 Tax=Taenia crassiceps TaxID=6207 RepID=A0ABR4Q5V2_9CEST